MIEVTKETKYTIVITDEELYQALALLLKSVPWNEMTKHVSGYEANLLKELALKLEDE